MAKGHRHYSGVRKTPESLSWMIRQRAWIDGRIKGLERQLDKIPGEIDQLRDQLCALDKVMSLHHIQVDPTTIKPVRKKLPGLGPYGSLTRHILTCLRTAGKPQTTTQVTLYLMHAIKLPLTRATQSRARRSVISALNTCRDNGFVSGRRLETGYDNAHNGEAIWELTPKKAKKRSLAHPKV